MFDTHRMYLNHGRVSTARRASQFVVLVSIVLVGLSGLAAAQAKQGTPLGSLFTPAHVPNTTGQDTLNAMLETAVIGGHISYMWEWSSGTTGFDRLRDLMPYYRALGFKVFIQINPTGLGEPAPPDSLPKSFADPLTRFRYLADVRKAAELKPEYINLAAEINLVYYLDRTQFDSFKTLYAQAYDLVKSVSPQTKVGVSYHMDLFFSDEGEFALTETLGTQDYIGFTTYPAWTVYQGHFASIADIPTIYYSRIRSVVPTKPVIFAEVGWPTGGRGSLDDQNAFVQQMPRLLGSVNPELITWTMLHDVNHFRVEALNDVQIEILRGFQVDPAQLFAELNSMGILSWDGPPKPAYLTAKTLVFSAP